jgi:hypothetical protein
MCQYSALLDTYILLDVPTLDPTSVKATGCKAEPIAKNMTRTSYVVHTPPPKEQLSLQLPALEHITEPVRLLQRRLLLVLLLLLHKCIQLVQPRGHMLQCPSV